MKYFICFIITLCSSLVFAQRTVDTYNYIENDKEILNLLERYSPEEIFIAIDIDNTLLAHTHDLGSDQWFRWQMGIMGTDSIYSVAKDFNELLVWYFQAINASDAHMRLTDTSLTKSLTNLRSLGIDYMALTARGPETLIGTTRELRNNNLIYASGVPQAIPLINKTIPAFEREIYYKNGLGMLGGQDKGEFIKYLLKQYKPKAKVVIMIDDQLKNVEKVHNAFEGSTIETLGLRFGGEDKLVNQFHASDKESVHKAFLELKKACDKNYL